MYKTLPVIFLALCSAILVNSLHAHAAELSLNDTPAKVYFSPKGGCTKAIIKEIDNATLEVLVQAHSFSSALIAKALATAKNRAAGVEIIIDKSQSKDKSAIMASLIRAGIPIYTDATHAVFHSNIIIIDKTTVITGSFSFTKTAEERNGEDLIIIKSKDLAGIYIDNFLKHKRHAEPYKLLHKTR